MSAASSTVFQFFFAEFKTTTISHENYVFVCPFSSMAIPPQNNEKTVLYTGKLYGLTGMLHVSTFFTVPGFSSVFTQLKCQLSLK